MRGSKSSIIKAKNVIIARDNKVLIETGPDFYLQDSEISSAVGKAMEDIKSSRENAMPDKDNIIENLTQEIENLRKQIECDQSEIQKLLSEEKDSNESDINIEPLNNIVRYVYLRKLMHTYKYGSGKSQETQPDNKNINLTI